MTRFLCTISLVTALLFPAPIAEAIELDPLDTVAGLGTEIAVSAAPKTQMLRATITPPLGPDIVMEEQVSREGDVSFWIDAKDTEMAGTYSVKIGETESSFTVSPDTFDALNSSIEVDHALGSSTATVSAIARDRYGNPLAGRSISLISSRSSDRVTPLSRETNREGEQQFRVELLGNGTATLRAIDLLSSETFATEEHIGQATAAVGGYAPAPQPQWYPPYPQYPVYPQYAPPPMPYAPSPFGAQLIAPTYPYHGQAVSQRQSPRFIIDSTLQVMEAKNDFATITLTAMNERGERDEGYNGMVLLSSTDPEALLPLDGIVPFVPANLGQKTLTLGLKFNTPGQHILLAQDSENGSLSGQLLFDVTGIHNAAGDGVLQVTSPEPNAQLATKSFFLEGVTLPFSNLTVRTTTQEFLGESDREGQFIIPIELDGLAEEVVLQIELSDSVQQSMTEHTVYLDINPPTADSISFLPENPVEETKVLLVVESEPNLSIAEMMLEGETYTLREEEKEPGTYQTLLTAPVGGVYTAIITLADSLGNTATFETELVVQTKGIPIVQGLQAASQVNAVALQWDGVQTQEIDGYRIYIGTENDGFLYTLDTKKTPTATVAGLDAGVLYTFAVTALKDGEESLEKSETVSARPKGITLNVTPGDSHLLLEWPTLEAGSTIGQFLLQYRLGGDDNSNDWDAEEYIHGDLRAYTLRNLLNGQEYHVQLTPITITGDILDDLAVRGKGTPTGSSNEFVPETSPSVPPDFFPQPPVDPINPIDPVNPTDPFDPPTKPAPPERPPVTPDPPKQPGTGLASSVLWIVLLLSGTGLLFVLRKEKAVVQKRHMDVF